MENMSISVLWPDAAGRSTPADPQYGDATALQSSAAPHADWLLA